MHKILVLFLLPLLFAGCNDLFDKGDTEKTYDGPDYIIFKPLELEAEEGESVTIEVQFISSRGLADSDVTANISVTDGGGDVPLESGHYELSATSVTIASGSASTELTVNFPADSGLEGGEEVILLLTLEDTGNVEAAENLKTSTIFLQGVD